MNAQALGAGAGAPSAMTYADVFYYLSGVNPNLAKVLDYGCRMGATIDEVLKNAASVTFSDPAASATWRSGVAMARAKVQEFGAGACRWADPRASAMAALMPSLPTEAQWRASMSSNDCPASTPSS